MSPWYFDKNSRESKYPINAINSAFGTNNSYDTRASNLQSNVSNSSSIDLVLKTFLNALPPEEVPLPNPVKALVQQVRNLFQQPESNSVTTSNTQLNSTISLPSRLQPLLNNPLLSEINNKPVTPTSIAHIQNALNGLAASVTSDPATTKIGECLQYLSLPKQMLSGPDYYSSFQCLKLCSHQNCLLR